MNCGSVLSAEIESRTSPRPNSTISVAPTSVQLLADSPFCLDSLWTSRQVRRLTNEIELVVVVTFCAALGCGLIAGAFLAFSSFAGGWRDADLQPRRGAQYREVG